MKAERRKDGTLIITCSQDEARIVAEDLWTLIEEDSPPVADALLLMFTTLLNPTEIVIDNPSETNHVQNN